MADLDEIRRALIRESRERADARERRAVYGRFGELLVEAWLRERQHLDVLTFPQDPGTKDHFIEGAGKRPDFLVQIPAGEAAPPVDVLVDAKFHTVEDGKPFWISDAEMELYDGATAQWEAEWLFFMVINAREPDLLHFIERREMVHEAANRRWEHHLGSNPGRTEAISPEELRRAVERLAREGFDPALLPTTVPRP